MTTSVNPATGEELARYDYHAPSEVDAVLTAAAAAQRRWAAEPVGTRAALLTRLVTVLRANRDRYACLITAEMGKPVVEAEGGVEKCAATLDFYAANAGRFLADEPVATGAAESMIVWDPLGVVLAIMPWNYPFWQFVRFLAPTLAAGNGAVLKHANNVPGCALAVGEALREAGAPVGLVGLILVDNADVAGIIADDRIAAVTLTGSTAVGSIVAAQAGRALKPKYWSLAARTRSSCWRTPTSRPRPRPQSRRASPTPAKAASRPSASSWSRTWPMPSPKPSSVTWRLLSWAIRWTAARR